MAWTNHPEDAYVDEIQRPPPQATPQSPAASQESWATGLGRSALIGAGTTLPYTIPMALTGMGMLPALGLETAGALSGMASYAAGRAFPHTWWAGPAAGLATGGIFGIGRSALTTLASEPAMVRSLALGSLGEGVGKSLNYMFPETIGPAVEHGLGVAGAISPYVSGFVRQPSNLLFPLAGGTAGGAVYGTTPPSVQLPDVNVRAPAPPIR